MTLFPRSILALACALLLTLSACDTADPLADGVPLHAAQKTAVCHATGSEANPYVLIDVADASLPAHTEHGDASPGEAVPGTDGTFAFDEACGAVPSFRPECSIEYGTNDMGRATATISAFPEGASEIGGITGVNTDVDASADGWGFFFSSGSYTESGTVLVGYTIVSTVESSALAAESEVTLTVSTANGDLVCGPYPVLDPNAP